MPARTKRPKAVSNVTKLVESPDLYTWDELPEENKKKYNTMLEDFDKTVEEHIEEAKAKVESTCKVISNAYRIHIYQLPKNRRDMNFEELVLQNIKDEKEGKVNVRESAIFSTKLKEVAENVAINVKRDVSTAVKKQAKIDSTKKSATGKKDKFGPVTSTGYADRKCEKVPERISHILSPVAHAMEPPALSITSNTPLSKSVLRVARQDEIERGVFLSLNGSPVIFGDKSSVTEKDALSVVAASASFRENSKLPEIATSSVGQSLSGLQEHSNVTEFTTAETLPVDNDVEVFEKYQSLKDQIGSLVKQRNE